MKLVPATLIPLGLVKLYPGFDIAALGTYPRSNPICVLAEVFNTLRKRRVAILDCLLAVNLSNKSKCNQPSECSTQNPPWISIIRLMCPE